MKKSPAPPKSLSAAAKRWWKEIADEFSIEDPGGIAILTLAAEAFDRMREAQALIKAEGMVAEDRFRQKKPHPAVVIERDCRAQILGALRALNLDTEPLNPAPGRPPGPARR